jgi:predicted Zn-dependent protease
MNWRMTGRRWLGLGAMVGLAVLLSNCMTAPITGRRQLSLVSDTQMQSMATEQYRQVLAEAKLSGNAAQKAMVQRAGVRISQATEAFVQRNGYNMTFQWEFNLIQDDQTVNAWCMPGGKIAFYTGIMPLCQDETGVAIVMGHEVAHALARHGSERVSQALVANIGLIGFAEALSNQPEQTRNLWLMAVGAGTQVGLLAYSRNQELEADRIGLILAAMAGYNPEAAVPFWERMEQASGGKTPPEFLSTHPSGGRRIEQLRRCLPEAMAYYHP